MKSTIKKYGLRLLVILGMGLFLVFTACDDGGKVRKYTEKVETPVAAPEKMTHGETASPQFKWETPAGWTEEKTGGGMRLAGFSVTSGERQSLCTIVPLTGTAGGLKANVERWVGQIGVDPAGVDVDSLIQKAGKFLTKSEFPAVFIDLTAITANSGDKSILASAITVGSDTVFIKMTGEKSHLEENRDKFESLCRSFSSK